MQAKLEQIVDKFTGDLRKWVAGGGVLTLEEVEKLLMTTVVLHFSRKDAASLLGVGLRTIYNKLGPIIKKDFEDTPCLEYKRNHLMEKKAQANPQDYFSCNACDRTFNRCGKANKHYRLLNTACPFCGSKDYENYSEL